MNRVSSSTAAWRAVYGYACADWLTIDSLQFLKTPSTGLQGEEHSHARISAGLPQILSSLKFQEPESAITTRRMVHSLPKVLFHTALLASRRVG